MDKNLLQPGENTGLFGPNPRIMDLSSDKESAIGYAEVMPKGDWRSSLPTFERQRNNLFDSNMCVTYSGHNILECHFVYLIENNLIPEASLKWLKDNGYMDSNGKVNFNDAFSAQLNGTTIDGNYLEAFWDGARRYGLIPQKDWVDVSEVREWHELMRPIPASLMKKAEEFKERFEILYEWTHLNEINIEKAAFHLRQSPLHIATPVCPGWNSGDVRTCGIDRLSHATTMVYAVPGKNYYILDHYEPAVKKLASDYRVPYAIKGIIRVKTPPQEPEKFTYNFTKVMRIGDRNKEVVALQKALILEGFLRLSDGTIIQPTGYFGHHTRNSVIKFQEKYVGDILTPLGLKYGTGLVSVNTLKKLNELYGKVDIKT